MAKLEWKPKTQRQFYNLLVKELKTKGITVSKEAKNTKALLKAMAQQLYDQQEFLSQYMPTANPNSN